jgi:hypothetical protein
LCAAWRVRVVEVCVLLYRIRQLADGVACFEPLGGDLFEHLVFVVVVLYPFAVCVSVIQ